MTRAPMKRRKSKQYIVRGYNMDMTFTAAEEARLKAETARADHSVERLIAKKIDARFARLRHKPPYEEWSELLFRFAQDLGKPSARRLAR